MKALGFIEMPSTTAAITALDSMCKTAEVEFVTWERKLGGRLVTIVIQGNVSAVSEALEVAAAQAILKPCVHYVIANPHEEIWRLVEISASKLKKKSDISKNETINQENENEV